MKSRENQTLLSGGRASGPPGTDARARRLALAALLVGLSACGPADRAARDTMELPVRAVGKGLRDIEKGVRDLGRGAIGTTVGTLLTDRNRNALLREHRELSGHLKKVNREIERLGITLRQSDRDLLTDAHDRLAAVNRQLEAPRIPFDVGARINQQLDRVQETINLIAQQYHTPRYAGFDAFLPPRSPRFR